MNDYISTIAKKDIDSFLLAHKHFDRSIEQCKKITISENSSEHELEKVEALTARFERLVDLFVMKLSKTIELQETGTNEGTMRDRMQLMEKIGIIKSSIEWIEMRALRNIIAHEYFYENLQELKKKIEDDCLIILNYTVMELQD